MKPRDCPSKPGRDKHTILDKGFFYGLSALTKLFEEEGVPYALYGGAGLQTHFCNYFSKNRSIDTAKDYLGRYLRPTSDYDFAVLKTENIPKIMAKINGRKESFEDEEHVVYLKRNGAERPILLVDTETTDSSYDTYIWLNFHDDNMILADMVANKKQISLVYNPLHVSVDVAPVEYTVAGKLARLGLHRDVPDLVNALEILDVDMNAVKSILERQSMIEDHVADALQLVAKARKKDKRNLISYLKHLSQYAQKY
jgi:hypothetical protein